MMDVPAHVSLQLRKIPILLLLIAFSLFLARGLYADDAADQYKTAVGYYKQKRYQKAAEQFQDFLSTHESHEKAGMSRLYLGLSLLYLDKFKDARDQLRRFADENKHDENKALARFRIAECSYLMNEFPTAKTELESFVKAYPDSVMCEDALPYLGDTLLMLDSPDPTAALAVFEKAIEKYPQGRLIDDSKFGRARSLESLKKLDDAVAQYREIATREKSPRAADALYHLGAILYGRSDFQEAWKAYSEFTERFPKNSLVPNAQLNAGYSLYHLKRYEEALRQFEKVAKDPGQKVTAIYWQGRCLKSLRDYAKAAAVLKSIATDASNHPLAEAFLFEQALCERNLDHLTEARQYFEQVLTRFPKGDYADDSLHYLIEMSIDAGELAEAERQLELFRQSYPNSPHRLLIEMLNGRLELARANSLVREKKPAGEVSPHYAAAARHFEQVLRESTVTRAKRQARYYLALTSQLQEQPAKALEIIGPLIEEVTAEGVGGDFADAIVLQADCYNQLREYAKAATAAAKYLELSPSGRQAARALSIQAQAASNLNDEKTAEVAIGRLKQDFQDHPATSAAMQRMAEAAENRGDWSSVQQIYESILRNQKDPEKRVNALRGLALAFYSQKDFREASQLFGKAVKELPNSEIAMECAYYQADSLARDKQEEQALELFQKIFAASPNSEPVGSGQEAEPPLVYFYKSGLWIATILRSMGRVDDSDAAYETLLKRFPDPKDLDAVLKDWALLNDGAERYTRSDEIWRRLIQERPNSPNANLARLHLAESDLISNERLDQARQTFEQLVGDEKCNPEIRQQALYQLITIAVEQERWSNVRSLGDQFLKEFPESKHRYYIVYTRAEMYFSQEKPADEDAAIVRERLKSLQGLSADDDVRNSPWFDRVWVLLAELDFQEKRYAEVVSTVSDLKTRNPKSEFLYQAEEILGRSYRQQAPPKFDEARAAFERCIANPFGKGSLTAAKAQFQIGDTFFFQEKWDNAVEAYNKVFSIHEFPLLKAEALLASAKCDVRRKDWKSVVNSTSLLIETFPDFAKIDEAKALLNEAKKRINE